MKKILISSFEDTLVDEEEAIDIKTILEIDKFRKNNNIFIIVSDNTLDDIINYNRDFPFTDIIIALDGSIIYNMESEKVIYKNTVSMATTKKIAKLTNTSNIEIYTTHNKIKYNDFISNYQNLAKDILKIGISCFSKEEIEDFDNKIKKNISNVKTNIVDNEYEYYLEIFSKKTSRVNALNKVLKTIKYDEKYFVVGSNKSIEIAETFASYAVSNASDSLKKIAKYELNNKNTFGVCELLKTINNL